MSLPNPSRQHLPYDNKQKGIQMDQLEAQLYEDYRNLSKTTNKTRNYQAIEPRPMQKRSSCNKWLSEYSKRPSQKASNSDKPPPDLNKPLPDLSPEVFEQNTSAATSAKIKYSSISQEEQALNDTVSDCATCQARQDKSQHRQTQAQSGDGPEQGLRRFQENSCEGRANKSREGFELENQTGKSRQRVRWLDEQ
ncbi:MAG: hypothetical protein OHK93_000799 [Ramalina farinacea]|uniref:Uncharacterized protein n=1 Tax=Ramalina farinacea TaxID=258253 RepID=A0AA43TYX6_9LECA|nr:hypothetical protein [Ramalina farinacea]